MEDISTIWLRLIESIEMSNNKIDSLKEASIRYFSEDSEDQLTDDDSILLHHVYGIANDMRIKMSPVLIYELICAAKKNKYLNKSSQNFSDVLLDHWESIDPKLLGKIKNFMSKIKIDFDILTDDSVGIFPGWLKDAHTRCFYYSGNLDVLKCLHRNICAAIVGSRRCSDNGLEQAARMASHLAKRDHIIVSGLAAGVDTVALKSAMDAGGKVIAIIGTPLSRVYPKENRDLQEKIAKEHLIISHVPFYTYENKTFRERLRYFPERNKIISAISDSTIVIEAQPWSGSLITANAALRQGRGLFIFDSKTNQSWSHFYEKKDVVYFKSPNEIIA